MKNPPCFLGESWCQLHWSVWVPFGSPNFKEIPSEPGFYRVKPINQNNLSYIGQTGRNLRARVCALGKHTLADEMPYNDPHTAAPCHWAWGKTHKFEFECSAAAHPSSMRKRLGYEYYLLWKYRLEYGESPLCNLGRYHPNYSRPTNRISGRLGILLPKNEINPASLKSMPPLQLKGSPFDNDWMDLNWVNTHKQKIEGQGVYKIVDLKKEQILYIGHSANLNLRLNTHRRKNWGVEKISIWVAELPENTLKHQRLELENDLLGGFYSLYQDLPRLNYEKLVSHNSSNLSPGN